MTKLALALTAVVSLTVPACVDGAAQEPAPAPARSLGCGTPAAGDAALAGQLTADLDGSLAGRLDAGEVACARAITDATTADGLDEQAAKIAITAAITETSLQNLRAGDSDRAGLFGQRTSQGWGLPDQLVTPAFATRAFLARMVADFPGDSWRDAEVGVVIATVQNGGAATPAMFEIEAGDAAKLAAAVWPAYARAR